jgi:hypothetical protein
MKHENFDKSVRKKLLSMPVQPTTTAELQRVLKAIGNVKTTPKWYHSSAAIGFFALCGLALLTFFIYTLSENILSSPKNKELGRNNTSVSKSLPKADKLELAKATTLLHSPAASNASKNNGVNPTENETESNLLSKNNSKEPQAFIKKSHKPLLLSKKDESPDFSIPNHSSSEPAFDPITERQENRHLTHIMAEGDKAHPNDLKNITKPIPVDNASMDHLQSNEERETYDVHFLSILSPTLFNNRKLSVLHQPAILPGPDNVKWRLGLKGSMRDNIFSAGVVGEYMIKNRWSLLTGAGLSNPQPETYPSPVTFYNQRNVDFFDFYGIRRVADVNEISINSYAWNIPLLARYYLPVVKEVQIFGSIGAQVQRNKIHHMFYKNAFEHKIWVTPNRSKNDLICKGIAEVGVSATYKKYQFQLSGGILGHRENSGRKDHFIEIQPEIRMYLLRAF